MDRVENNNERVNDLGKALKEAFPESYFRLAEIRMWQLWDKWYGHDRIGDSILPDKNFPWGSLYEKEYDSVSRMTVEEVEAELALWELRG